MDINWNEFKQFKKSLADDGDNFTKLLDFLQSYYNMVSVNELYETLNSDELAIMMLERKNIKNIIDMENFLFHLKR